MKATCAAVLFALLIAAPLSWAGPAFGVKAGLNLANMTFDPDDGITTDIRAGLGIGGDVEFSLTPTNKITVRTDVMYMMKGAKETEEGIIEGYPYTSDITLKVDELVIAPFVVFRFPSGKVVPFLQVGPELGFNVTKKFDYDITIEGLGSESGTGDIEDYASTNFGINLGGGLAVPAGKGEVVFDARYNLGLTNMNTADDDMTVKTNGIQILVGYNFSIPTR